MTDELRVPFANGGMRSSPVTSGRPSPLLIPNLTSSSEKETDLKLPRLTSTPVANRGHGGSPSRTTQLVHGARTSSKHLLIQTEQPEGGCSYEATCLLTLLNDMLTGVNIVAFLDQFARNLDAILTVDGDGSVVRKLKPIAPLLALLQEHARTTRGALASEGVMHPTGRVLHTVRHVVRFGRQLWRADLEFRVMVLVKSNKSMRVTALGATLRHYLMRLDSHLRVDAELDNQRAVKLRRARHLTARHELAIAELRSQINDVEKIANSEIMQDNHEGLKILEACISRVQIRAFI